MANNRIKGITIEIDGNTVKLEDSLKDVNDSLSKSQKELKDVNKLLKLDPKNTELLKQKTDLLNKAIDDTDKKLQAEKKALEQLENSADNSKTIEQQKALKREIEATEQSLKAYKQELKDVPNNLTKLADATGKLSEKTKLLSTTAAAGLTAMAGMAVKAGAMADDLNTMAKQSGFSTEEIQKWQYASDRIDVSVDTIVAAGAKLTRNMASTSSSVTEAFEQLGVSVTDSTGKIRPTQEVFYDVIEALGKIPNETERDIVAMELFGKSANSLAGIVDDGGEALRNLGQEAVDAGLILSQDALDGANEFNDGLDKIKAQAQQTFYVVGAQIAETLLPIMEDLVKKIGEIVEWIASVDSDTIKLVGTILLVTASLSGVLKAISGVFGALNTINSFLPTLTKGITSITGATVSGVGTASGAISSLTAATGGWAVALLALIPIIYKVVEAISNMQDAEAKANHQQMLNKYQKKLQAGEEFYYNPDDYIGVYNGNGGFDYYAKSNSAPSHHLADWEDEYGTTNNYNFDVNVQNVNDLQTLIDMSNQAQLLNRMGGSN